MEDTISMDIDIISEKELKDSRKSENGKTWYINKNKIIYQNADLILRLWEKLKKDNSQEKKLEEYLIRQLAVINEYNTGGNFISCSQLFFYTLLRMNLIEELFNSLNDRNNMKNYSNTIFTLIKEGIEEILSYLNRTQVNRLYYLIINMSLDPSWNNSKGELIESLIDVRVNLLESSLNKIDSEINTDKTQLIKKIQNWGFNEKYNLLLTSIDKYIQNEDVTINSGMISNLREFISSFIIELAEKITKKEKDNIPEEGDTKIGNCRLYLKSKLNLSKEENSFYNQFIIILHNEGGHSFSSDKEYFRLARNIAIELSLFLMTKYERKYKKKKILGGLF